jgi:hypothetical protein
LPYSQNERLGRQLYGSSDSPLSFSGLETPRGLTLLGFDAAVTMVRPGIYDRITVMERQKKSPVNGTWVGVQREDHKIQKAGRIRNTIN